MEEAGDLCSAATILDTTVYIKGTSSLTLSDQFFTGDPIEISPVVKFKNNTVPGTEYTVTITDSNNALVNQVVDTGTYNVTVTCNGPTCYGTKSGTFRVLNQLTGTGTLTDPYKIGSSDEWSSFIKMLDSSNKFEDQYVVITENFITTEGATSGQFSGHLNGQNHTITFNFTADSQQGLFKYISNATIENLNIDGTFTADQYSKSCGVLSGRSDNTVTIRNCHVSSIIQTKYDADYIGGFIGCAYKTLNMENCVFNGQLLGYNSNSTSFGGFVGSCYATLNAKNCVFNPSEINNKIQNDSQNFAKLSSNGKVNGNSAYYIISIAGSTQGTPVYNEKPEDNISTQVTLDGNNYYVTGFIESKQKYAYVGEIIHPEPVVTHPDGTVLTKGVDYTVSYSAENDSEPGNYTFTVNAVEESSWHGSKTVSYTVEEPTEVSLGNFRFYQDANVCI